MSVHPEGTQAPAAVRRALKAQLPRLPRGRPRKGQAQRRARMKRRLKARRTVLSQHRYLLVKRRLTARDRRILRRMGRTLKPVRDLRGHFWPDLERALNVLDHPDLPATSNAVERANRRYRKMQKSIYRVRTLKAIRGRIVLDLLREEQAPQQQRLMERLHQQRQEERTHE